jgi:tRNA threonylcarbamoyladenosine biosynthesis protein TsaE
MLSLELTSHSPNDTIKIGAGIGKLASGGDIFLLTGSLGTGKTCLTQGIARGLGIKEHTPSPSFVLIRQFHGRLTLYHIDLYRLDSIDEIADLGLDDYLYGDGVCVIEWAEKGLRLLPREHLMIEMSYLGDTERQLVFKPGNQLYREMLLKLRSISG